MNGNARKLAAQDESVITSSGIPYTIIRTGSLTNTPGGKQGFSFEEVLFFTPVYYLSMLVGAKTFNTAEFLNIWKKILYFLYKKYIMK